MVKPEAIVPGVATYYASTYMNGGDACPVLVKTREGRPIKIEGNDLSPVTMGGTSARAQASVLDLYDTFRLKQPRIKEEGFWSDTSWKDLDEKVVAQLNASKNIRLVTNTILSPTAHHAIKDFTSAYPQTKVVTYDPVSSAAILEANEMSFGERSVPSYHFDKAKVIVSFNADFLGTWISPIEYAGQYARTRVIGDAKSPEMSRHIQVESHMSLTGSNADNRILVKPSELGAAIAFLYNEVAGTIPVPALNEKAKSALSKVANELKAAKGASLVVSGSNNIYEQILVNDINNALANYGKTIDFTHASMQRQGNERDLETLLAEIQGGMVDAIIFMGANPVYDYHKGAAFGEALEGVANKIAIAYRPDETTELCNYIAPTHHYLESWGDAEIKRGHYTLLQPTIAPLFNTRQDAHSLLSWSGYTSEDEQPYLAYLRNFWESEVFPKQDKFLAFNMFWDQALHDGIVSIAPDTYASKPVFNADIQLAARKISQPSEADLEITFFETVNMGNGQFSTNPWLQELPDPVGRTVWNNYLAVPVNFDGVRKFKGMNNLNDGDIVTLTIGENSYSVPVIQQFGLMPGTVALALGYGRTVAGKCGTGIGVNINDVLTSTEGLVNYYNTNVSLSARKGKEDDFACVQYHHTIGVQAEDKKTGETINADEAATVFQTYGLVRQGYQGSLTNRSIIFNSNLSDLGEDLKELHEKREEFKHLNEQTLYPYEKYSEELYSQGHHWGMHIDLNACIGCGACAVACMAENNVPVVGKKEVSRHHEMTWLRIDRYYYGDAENPNVVYQPMMCQHCDNAPCENVCPVNASNHSSEGLNQMAYNRCVGTRYCANNCPYKVRRFNWLDYTTADIFPANQPTLNDEEIPFGADNLTRMVLNPDVTVRSRGVIEKCSFCVQRIQEGKLLAKREGRRLQDKDVRSACQTACPTGAITFGDTNNKKGDLSKKLNSPLNYVALEETNVRSSVNYSMKVINKDESLDV